MSIDIYGSSSGVRLELTVSRVLHTWSLIRQVDENEQWHLRMPLMSNLCYEKNLSDHELFVAGLKYLYRRATVQDGSIPLGSRHLLRF
jgi:hypothetical protein